MPATTPETQSIAKREFNASAARTIRGELTPIPAQEIDRIREKSSTEYQDIIAQAMPEDYTPELYEDASLFYHASILARKTLTVNQLKKAIADSQSGASQSLGEMTTELAKDFVEFDTLLTDQLQNNTDAQHALPMKQLEAFLTEPSGKKPFEFKPRSSSKVRQLLSQLFSSVSKPVEDKPEQSPNGRIYFRLHDHSNSSVYAEVEEFLTAKGYTITDYAGGYAVDGRKNQWKIGKILKDVPPLLDAYQQDFTRFDQDLMVVMTNRYDDISRASFHRAWESCRSDADSAVSRGVDEVNAGVISCYLVRANDPDILNPLGRINLKPYDSKDNKTVYLAFNPIGVHHPGFADAINRFSEEYLNQGKFGRFSLRDGCESYREFDDRYQLPMDAKGALDKLKVKYTVSGSGQITVPGSLIMCDMGLTRLPDFSDVIVEGGMNISNNKLLSLDGMPKHRLQFLDVSKNLLTSLEGCPPILEYFDYRENPYLVTNAGYPKAAVYKYGNDKSSASPQCIGPIQAPDYFPSFKK